MPDVVRCKRVFGFHAHGIAWLAAHGNLLLALRHPQNIGASRELMLELVERLGQALVEWGVLSEQELTQAMAKELLFELQRGLRKKKGD